MTLVRCSGGDYMFSGTGKESFTGTVCTGLVDSLIIFCFRNVCGSPSVIPLM